MARYLAKRADRAKSDRADARRLTQPINKPKGIDRDVVRENGATDTSRDDAVATSKRDIQPRDVFTPTPRNTAVLSLVESGKDLETALEKQVPRDKGYDTVSNLSQYLIETKGGGSGRPAGRR